eukprot:3430070-Ditylum_brightwellii.AAC.1
MSPRQQQTVLMQYCLHLQSANFDKICLKESNQHILVDYVSKAANKGSHILCHLQSTYLDRLCHKGSNQRELVDYVSKAATNIPQTQRTLVDCVSKAARNAADTILSTFAVSVTW